ncbi:MAG: sulfide/dihydroorotate dehydrogenase-like FAD/NAD-binding protein, partial [Clostridia bacterium]|nr:sulfide/dihydroorotate dehydrogenase-like FAD/NAD-binding protein [Clostridia bacterium]
IARALKEMGASVTSIIGFRNKDLVILEDEFNACSNELIVMTDDGSYGRSGNVCIPLNEMFERGETFDEVITIGPLIMMKFVTLAVKPTNIPCTCSMNSIMIDGTGMCGCCRLTLNVNGEKVTKFACVDGPDFNGYEIDFDEAMSRGTIYSDFERERREETCNLLKKGEQSNG